MKQLILLRHAEAQAQRPGLSDFDRALTGHGRTQALDAAECLKRAAVRFDLFLVSPAVRARETALIVAAQLDFDDELLYDQLLFDGEAPTLLQPLQRCDARAGAVLMVGHNPTLSALARHLAAGVPITGARGSRDAPGNGALGRASSDQPLELSTAGLCRVQFQSDSWSDLQPQAVTAVSLMR
jgi:phosphohistidine phosphatase